MRPQLLAEPVFFQHCARWERWRWALLPVSVEAAHRVVFDTATGASLCTCPFRPRPCVHAQAFALVVQAADLQVFEEQSEPPEWLTGVGPAVAPRKVRGASPDDERSVRIQRGLEDLEAWLADTLQRGVAVCAAEDPQFYLTASARLADASMRGLSRRIRTAGEAFARQLDHPEPFVAALADAALAIQAWKRRDRLSEAQRNDLEAFLGFTPKKEAVRAQRERLSDIWAVVGASEETLEASLRERRTWLLGAKSGRFALLQDYAFGAEDFPPAFLPGVLVQGTVAYYPSAWPLRALPIETLETIPERKVKKLPGWRTFSEMTHTFARALARHPWLPALPAALIEVRPLRSTTGFALADGEGFCVLLGGSEQECWVLLALSEGRPIAVFGEWDGERLRALSAICEERLVSLGRGDL
ncbi:MAG: hypothetical protein RMJ33_08455 [Saprospiraceae bacterium]|nr:hypothetical protein [Saprospiraceae bacterium]MDW8229855.1 hypothetical protein [Saprospiraceae bacterium]